MVVIRSSEIVDLKLLNESVLREVHSIPREGKALAKWKELLFFRIDANSGFWKKQKQQQKKGCPQNPAYSQSSLGRYYFNKLPFDISSIPELHQRRMNFIIKGLAGETCLMYDILTLVTIDLSMTPD